MTTKEACKFLDCSTKTLTRYVKKGLLTRKGSSRNPSYNPDELRRIATEFHLNKNTHRPEEAKPKVKVLKVPTEKQVRKFFSSPVPDLLNDNGKSVLTHTARYLEDKGLKDHADPNTIMRYAFAVQMKMKYTEIALQGEETKYWLDIVKQFQSEIQHYEKELGLTPAALDKIKLRDTEETVIDPMEALLSGN